MIEPRHPGPLALGDYLLHGEIASGGMASVHLGERVPTAAAAAPAERWVAIKRLRPHLAGDPDFTAMFLEETRLAARVQHPNVVATLDVLAHGGELLLVMELVRGVALASVMRGGPVAPPLAARLVLDVLHGLHAAHEARDEHGAPLEIVHRDVSPQNVLVGVDGLARVADFGVAHAAGRGYATAPGRTKGKLAYMAPEQLGGAGATRRVDVYAASVVLWELLTGQRLFRGDTASEVFGRVLEGVVRPPSSLARVPAAVDALVLRGLARDPTRRHATARDLAEALERALVPATPRDVAAWLPTVAGPEIAAQDALVAELTGPRPRGAARAPRRTAFAQVASRGPALVGPEPAGPATDDTVTVPRPAARPARKQGRSMVGTVLDKIRGKRG